MLTFEKVLEIFADYLTADETIEVYISRHGCVRVEFDQDFHINTFPPSCRMEIAFASSVSVVYTSP